MTHDQLIRDLVHVAVCEAVNSVHDALYSHVFITSEDWGTACREAVAMAEEDFANNLEWHRRKRAYLTTWIKRQIHRAIPRIVRDCTDEYCDWRQTCLWFCWFNRSFPIPGTTIDRA
jgi:hypothetical protein